MASSGEGHLNSLFHIRSMLRHSAPPVTLDELGRRNRMLLFPQHWCSGCHSRGSPSLLALVDKPRGKITSICDPRKGKLEGLALGRHGARTARLGKRPFRSRRSQFSLLK